MLNDIKLINMASALARHSATRHKVISENIANADTRNYKARDLEEFSTAYTREATGIAGRASGGLDTGAIRWRAMNVADIGAHSPNGNTVSLEEQIMKGSQAQADHDAAATIYRKAIDILRMSMGRNA